MGRSWDGRTRKPAWVAGTWGWEWEQARNRDPQRQLSPGTLSELRAWVVVFVARGGRRLGCRAQCSCVIRGNGAHAHIRKLSMKARAWDWRGERGCGRSRE